MKKNGKISTGILVTIIILAFIFVIGIISILGVIAFTKVNRSKQEQTLSDEITSMTTSQKINENLKTTGKYAVIEKALKAYYSECIIERNNLLTLYNGNSINSSLAITNISNDGPEFNKTKENITNIKDTEKTIVSKYEQLCSSDYIAEKASLLELNSYYTNLYITHATDISQKISDELSKVKAVTSDYDRWLDKINETLDFLTENKDNWQVQSNNIAFTSSLLVIRYNGFVTQIKSIETTLKTNLNKLQYNY